MMLSILTAHYKESYQTLRNLLTSIAMQQGIDFNEIQMIICNDGSEMTLDRSRLKKYPFEIEYHIRNKTNVSQTKQACLDYAVGDYIIFCDSDDMFIDLLALRNLFDILQEESPDILISDFIEDNCQDGAEKTFVNMGKASNPYLHGKIYKRKFLIENHISMNPNFEILEDMHFSFLALDLVNPSKIINTGDYVFYLKKDNSYSFTQNIRDFNFYKDIYMVDVAEVLIKEHLERGNSELAQYYFLDLMFMTYYKLNMAEWLSDNNKKYRDALEEEFASLYSKFHHFYDSADKKLVLELKNEARDASISMETETELISFEDWLQHIKNICIKYV